MTDPRIHRVVVRGRFVDLPPRAEAMVAANVAEHDVVHSAFTAEGTLTYDAGLDFVNARYEIRGAADDDEAGIRATAQASELLAVLGVVPDRPR